MLGMRYARTGGGIIVTSTSEADVDLYGLIRSLAQSNRYLLCDYYNDYKVMTRQCNGFAYVFNIGHWDNNTNQYASNTVFSARGMSQLADEISRYNVAFTTGHEDLLNRTGGYVLMQDSNNPSGTYVKIRVVGMNQDITPSGRTSGFTFMSLPYDDARGNQNESSWNLPTGDGTWSPRMRMNGDQWSGPTKGGWASNGIRRNLNSGQFWNALPSEVRSNVRPVLKKTNSTEPTGSSYGTWEGYATTNVTADTTVDKVWLPSVREVMSSKDDYGNGDFRWYPIYKTSNTEYRYYSFPYKSYKFMSENQSGNSDYSYSLWFRDTNGYSYDHTFFYHRNGIRSLDYRMSSNSHGVMFGFCF